MTTTSAPPVTTSAPAPVVSAPKTPNGKPPSNTSKNSQGYSISQQGYARRPSGGRPSGSPGARMPIFVLVAGPPGSGKSTVAAPLAAELGLPLLAKDAIKEALMGALGPPATVEESRRLGRAAVMAMLAVARSAPGAVLDSTFYPYTVPHLGELPGALIELRCRCPREVAQARYRARASARQAGHLDDERPPEELWNLAGHDRVGILRPLSGRGGSTLIRNFSHAAMNTADW